MGPPFTDFFWAPPKALPPPGKIPAGAHGVTSTQQRLKSDPNRKRLFHPILIRFGFTFGTSCANLGSESWIRLRVTGGVHFHNVNGRSFRLKVGTTEQI